MNEAANADGTRYPHLFAPLQIGSLSVPNRIAMAPMSTQLGDEDGHVTPPQIAFYRERAPGGTGMIIVEFCCVQKSHGRTEHRQLVLEDDGDENGHRPLVEAIRAAGAIACVQLHHAGPGVKRSLTRDGIAVGPSDVRSRRDPDKLTCRAMDDDELEALIEKFGRAAELGVSAGYQAFELHGAHGYLLTTFLSPLTNHRDDAWGGDEARRLQFPARVIARVKQAIGDRPLIYRLSADEFSPDGLSIDDMERIAPKLVAAGVDAWHVSIGHGTTSFDKIIEPMSMPEGWRLPYARRIRAAVDVPVIAVGQIRWPATAERAIADGDTDMVALGRTLLADPQWAEKARRGESDKIRPCTSCNYCISMSSGPHGTIGCAENPRTGRELEPLPDAGSRRGERAVVLGGGPGGMAAALMLDQAGYRTELYETRPMLGGGLIASAAPPFKDKLRWYQDYLERQLTRSTVHVALNRTPDCSELSADKPAFVMLATGASPNLLDVSGLDHPLVRDAYEVLMGDDGWLPESTDAAPVIVYGGGETGCEAAEYVAERGYRVVLITRSAQADLARSAEPVYRRVLLGRLADNPLIEIREHTHVIAVDDAGVSVRRGDEAPVMLTASRLLIAQGRRPDRRLPDAFAAAGIEVVTIGDATRGGRIGDAVHAAYEAVRTHCERSVSPGPLAC